LHIPLASRMVLVRYFPFTIVLSITCLAHGQAPITYVGTPAYHVLLILVMHTFPLSQPFSFERSVFLLGVAWSRSLSFQVNSNPELVYSAALEGAFGMLAPYGVHRRELRVHSFRSACVRARLGLWMCILRRASSTLSIRSELQT